MLPRAPAGGSEACASMRSATPTNPSQCTTSCPACQGEAERKHDDRRSQPHPESASRRRKHGKRRALPRRAAPARVAASSSRAAARERDGARRRGPVSTKRTKLAATAVAKKAVAESSSPVRAPCQYTNWKVVSCTAAAKNAARRPARRRASSHVSTRDATPNDADTRRIATGPSPSTAMHNARSQYWSGAFMNVS